MRESLCLEGPIYPANSFRTTCVGKRSPCIVLLSTANTVIADICLLLQEFLPRRTSWAFSSPPAMVLLAQARKHRSLFCFPPWIVYHVTRPVTSRHVLVSSIPTVPRAAKHPFWM